MLTVALRSIIGSRNLEDSVTLDVSIGTVITSYSIHYTKLYDASDINDEMKIAAAKAIASLVSDDELCPEYIIPAPFDNRVGKIVAEWVAEAARKTGVARI